MMSERGALRAFVAVVVLLFTASLVATVLGCQAMAAAGELVRPCGWTRGLGWTPGAGQSRLAAAVSFLAMWTVMMVAMMLPSLLPVLWRTRVAAGTAGAARPAMLTALVGFGYFLVWTAVGIVALPLALGLSMLAAELPARNIPDIVGLVVLGAGALQFTAWKTRRLTDCRAAGAWTGDLRPVVALQHGLRLGRHCIASCAGASAILVVTGGMDLAAMALVTAAVTLERLAPGGPRMARVLGVVVIGAGGWLMVGAG